MAHFTHSEDLGTGLRFEAGESIIFTPKPRLNAYKCTIECKTFPSKKNSKQLVWLKNKNRNVVLSSNEYAAWEKSAVIQVKSWMQEQKIKHKVKFPFTKISLHTIMYYPDLRVRDLSNAVEGVNDVLVSCGVLSDDRWTVLSPSKQTGRLDKKRPRIELYFSQPED